MSSFKILQKHFAKSKNYRCIVILGVPVNLTDEQKFNNDIYSEDEIFIDIQTARLISLKERKIHKFQQMFSLKTFLTIFEISKVIFDIEKTELNNPELLRLINLTIENKLKNSKTHIHTTNYIEKK